MRRISERMVHPVRRRRARSAIHALGPSNVLFICLGNICRSPFAAALLRGLLKDPGNGGRAGAGDQRVGSAGFIRPGRRPPAEARRAATLWNVDLYEHRSHVVEPRTLSRYDLLVVMEDRHRERLREEFGAPRRPIVVLGDLDPRIAARRGIPDPVDRPLPDFVRCYARIERCVRSLHSLLPAHPGTIREPRSGRDA